MRDLSLGLLSLLVVGFFVGILLNVGLLVNAETIRGMFL